MRFGVSTQLYHGQRLRRAHLDEIAAHGFETIEIVATRTHLDYHDPAALDELAGWLGETGLRLHSIHAPVTEAVVDGQWGAPFSNASPDRAVRERAVAETKPALALAGASPGAGARRAPRPARTHAGGPGEQQPGRGAPERRARSSRRPRAVGVRVALENIPERAVDARVDRLADRGRTGAADAGRVPGLRPRAPHGRRRRRDRDDVGRCCIATHVHDNHGSRRRAPGAVRGHDRLAGGVMMALQKVGYDGVLMLEVAARGRAARRSIAGAGARRRRTAVRTRKDGAGS